MAASIAFINQVSLNQKTSKSILGNEAALQSICQYIIVPNVEFRQSGTVASHCVDADVAKDEDLFEEDPQEYIKRDIEGSDSDTRRRAACELVRGLRKVRYRFVSSQLDLPPPFRITRLQLLPFWVPISSSYLPRTCHVGVHLPVPSALIMV